MRTHAHRHIYTHRLLGSDDWGWNPQLRADRIHLSCSPPASSRKSLEPPAPHHRSCCITAVQMEGCPHLHLHQRHHDSILLAAASEIPETTAPAGPRGGWTGRIYPTQSWQARARARAWTPQPVSFFPGGESSKQLLSIFPTQPRLRVANSRGQLRS